MRGAFHGDPEFDWFRAFLYLEAYVETVLSFPTRKLTSPHPQNLPTTGIFDRDKSVLLWSTEVTDLVPAHPRLLRLVVYHHLRLSRLFLDVHWPNSIPNVGFNGKLCPILPGAVWDGGRHGRTPD